MNQYYSVIWFSETPKRKHKFFVIGLLRYVIDHKIQLFKVLLQFRGFKKKKIPWFSVYSDLCDHNHYFVLFYFFILSRNHTRHGAWTHDPESKSHMLYWMSQLGTSALSNFRTVSSSQKKALARSPHILFLSPWQPLIYSLSLQICLIRTFHENRVVQCEAFCD